jgi:hypothetical protein
VLLVLDIAALVAVVAGLLLREHVSLHGPVYAAVVVYFIVRLFRWLGKLVDPVDGRPQPMTTTATLIAQYEQAGIFRDASDDAIEGEFLDYLVELGNEAFCLHTDKSVAERREAYMKWLASNHRAFSLILPPAPLFRGDEASRQSTPIGYCCVLPLTSEMAQSLVEGAIHQFDLRIVDPERSEYSTLYVQALYIRWPARQYIKGNGWKDIVSVALARTMARSLGHTVHREPALISMGLTRNGRRKLKEWGFSQLADSPREHSPIFRLDLVGEDKLLSETGRRTRDRLRSLLARSAESTPTSGL